MRVEPESIKLCTLIPFMLMGRYKDSLDGFEAGAFEDSFCSCSTVPAIVPVTSGRGIKVSDWSESIKTCSEEVHLVFSWGLSVERVSCDREC